jgi:hypothetical protein
MATPAWKGASANNPGLAGQINQFLGTHNSTFIYTGTSQLSQTTAGAGGTNSNSLYIAQTFTTSGAVGTSRLVLTLDVTGSPPPATITIQSNSGGAPSGTVLGSITVAAQYLTGSAVAVSVPMLVSLSATTQYWIVINAVGDVSNFYTWFKSNQVTGASTSPTGSVWTTQAYGLLYNVFAGAGGNLVHIYDDAGARWTTFTWTAGNLPLKLSEYTVAQAANDYVQSVRTFSYAGNVLTGVA